MKATFFTLTTLLASALAGPALSTRQTTVPTSTTISLANDFTGANAPSAVDINAGPIPLGALFQGTALDQGGRIIATSAQLTTIIANVFCIVNNPVMTLNARLNDKITFADLDGNAGAAVPTDVTDFTIECQF